LERGQYDLKWTDETKRNETKRDGTSRVESGRIESSRVESIDRPTMPVRDPPLTEIYKTGACVEKRSLLRAERIVDKKEECERTKERTSKGARRTLEIEK